MQCCMHKHDITRVRSRQMMESGPKTENLYGPHLTVSYPGHRTKFDSTKRTGGVRCHRESILRQKSSSTESNPLKSSPCQVAEAIPARARYIHASRLITQAVTSEADMENRVPRRNAEFDSDHCI